MTTPLKRHPALIPLSRDHHEGLLVAVRLQQGTNALLRLWSHDLLWQAEYVVMFFDEHLSRHFEEEEKILFPIAKAYLAEHQSIVDRLLNEHEEMRSMVERFREPEENQLSNQLKTFGKILEQHIRCEERELFPLCEKKIPADGWETIQTHLHQFHPAKRNESNNQ